MVDFRKDPSERAPKCSEAPTSFPHSVCDFSGVSDGGLHLLYTPGGLYRFETPPTLAAREAVTLGDAGDGGLAYPGEIVMKLHVKWGHASAQQ